MSYITEQNQPPGWYPESTGETSGDVTVRPLSVAENGTYTAPSGTAYSPVDVNVEAGLTAEALSVVANGTYTAPSGKAYTPVNVNVPVGATTQSLTVTENGTYTAPSGKAYTPVVVNVPAASSGYAKKTGSFVLASDYDYSNRADQTYTGSILIETGLSHIDSLIVWSEEWATGEAAANCFGISMAFTDCPPTDTNVSNPPHYYSGISYMKNGTNSLAWAAGQGVFFRSMSSNIAEGSFGLRCHNAGFPIRAGHTIRWEAWGAE